MTNLYPFNDQIMNAQSVDETVSGVKNCIGFPYLGAYVVGNGTTSSGVITFEEAPSEDFAGAWSSIATMDASDVTGGITKAQAFTVRAYAYVRARISTVIGGGGTVTVYLTGAPGA